MQIEHVSEDLSDPEAVTGALIAKERMRAALIKLE
jgi:hypothetical protein